MTTEYDVIVAGGGIAGLTAGLVSARLGRKTLVLTGDVLGGHLLSIEKIEGYPGHPEGVAGYELCPLTQAQASEAGAEIAAAEVLNIAADGDGWRIATAAGEHAAHAVILATGTSLKELGVPGEERLRGKGVSHCASCDAPLLRDKVVTVIGGGDSACQEALTLAEAASLVIMLHRADSLSAQSSFRDRVEANPKIEIQYGRVVDEVLGDTTVTGVRVRDCDADAASDLEADGVFIYIGLSPNTAFLNGTVALDGSGGISTDGSMRTSRKGIFAAGTVRSDASGRAVSSAGDGTAAAIAADRYLADGVWRDD